MPVSFYASTNDHTGYGNAVKNFSKAFSNSGIRTKFIFSGKDTYPTIRGLKNYNLESEIEFHLKIPNNIDYSSKNYKIGYFYWEADRLPDSWSNNIKKLNEIWAPCNLVKRVCQDAGFRGPIKIIPTPCENWISDQRINIPSPYSNNLLEDDVYKFYSIFQWHTRKGYKTLLRAYYNAFGKEDRVILILKVNPIKNTPEIIQNISQNILDIKSEFNLKYYPPIFLSTDIITKDEIRAVHNSFDCFVLPHHGEGWGMPICDAMLSGKQIITTKYGGVTEWLDNSSAHIIEHKMGPVRDMEWNQFYNKNQNWAYPNEEHLTALLKDVYLNNRQYTKKGELAKDIAKKFLIDPVASTIYEELRQFK
jgi:Glycosyl transferases group 1